MRLPTALSIPTATEDDLIPVLRAVSARLRELNEQRALQTAMHVLLQHGHRSDLVLTIGVDEWDDGYFYAGVNMVLDASGSPVRLSPEVVESLDSALKEPLTELTYAEGPLGRQAGLTLDLVTNSVTY